MTLHRLLSCVLTLSLCAISALCQSAVPTETAETHVGRGYEALKLDRYDDAVREFRAALVMDPTLVERAQFPLAVTLFEQHKLADSRQELEAVRRKVGDHPNVLYYLGRIEIEDRNFAAAIHDLSQAVETPPFPDTAYYLGFAYLKQNDLPSAEKWLIQAQTLLPRDARVPYQLGLVYQKEGKQEEAQKLLKLSEDLRQRDDRDSRLKVECAQKLDQGLREEARAVCDQLYDPTSADKLMELGITYAQHGDPEAALKPFQKAAELAPQSPQMQFNLAMDYFQLNQFEKARTPLTTALQRWPDLFQLNALYGAVLYRLGEQQPAYTALHHAFELNPRDRTNLELLFEVELELGAKHQTAHRYREAVKTLKEAAQLKPADPRPHRQLAEIYKSMGLLKQSVEEKAAAEKLQSDAAAN